jgi:hypothetical protein
MMKKSRDEQEQETMVLLTPQLVFYLFFSKLQISCKEFVFMLSFYCNSSQSAFNFHT